MKITVAVKERIEKLRTELATNFEVPALVLIYSAAAELECTRTKIERLLRMGVGTVLFAA